MGRKTRGVEKVENLYRTARVQNDSINTSDQSGSRLRDAGRRAVVCDRGPRAAQDESMEGQFHEQPRRHAGDGGDAAQKNAIATTDTTRS
jgi:hypothetical protein